MNESTIQNTKRKRKSRIQKHEKGMFGGLIRPRNTLEMDKPLILRKSRNEDEVDEHLRHTDPENHDIDDVPNNDTFNQSNRVSDDDIVMEENVTSFSSTKKLNVPLESLKIWDLTPKFHNDIMIKKSKDTLIMASLVRTNDSEINEKCEYQLKLVGSGLEMLRLVDLQSDVSHVYYDQSETSVGLLLSKNRERELRLSYKNVMYSYKKLVFKISSSVDEIMFNQLISILSYSVDPSLTEKKKYVKKCKDYHGILTLMNHERMNENDQNKTVLLHSGNLSPTSIRREKKLATIENGISERSMLSRNSINFLNKKFNSLENPDRTRFLGNTRYTTVNRTEPQARRKPSLISSPLMPPSRLPAVAEKESHIVSKRSLDDVKTTEKPLSTLAFYGLGEESQSGQKSTKKRSTSTEGFNPSIYSDSDEEKDQQSPGKAGESHINLDENVGKTEKTYVRRSKRHRVSSLDYDEDLHTEPTFDFGGDLKYQFQDNSIMQITNKDFQCLFNSDWVNDSLIDFFLKFFREREQQKKTVKKVKVSDIIGSNMAKQEDIKHLEKDVNQKTNENLKQEMDQEKQTLLDKTYIFNTFFFTKLINCKNSFDNVLNDKWLNKNDCEIFTKHDYLIVPINYNYHWFGCIIENYNKSLLESFATETKNIKTELPSENGSNTKDSEKSGIESSTPLAENRSEDSEDLEVVKDSKNKITIYVFDSLRFSHSLDIKIIKDFLVQFAQKKFNVEIDKKQIKFKNCQVPLQPNMSDCGIHLILNAEKFFEDPEKTISMWNENSLKHNASLSKDNFLLNEFFQKKQRKLGRKLLRQTLLDLKTTPANLNLKKEEESSDLAHSNEHDKDKSSNNESSDKYQGNNATEDTHEDDDVEIIELVPTETKIKINGEMEEHLTEDSRAQTPPSKSSPKRVNDSQSSDQPPHSDVLGENCILTSQVCASIKTSQPEQNSSPPSFSNSQEPQISENTTVSKASSEKEEHGLVHSFNNMNESSPNFEKVESKIKQSNDSISTTLNKINVELGEPQSDLTQTNQRNGTSHNSEFNHAEISDSDSNADARSSSSNESSMNLLHEHSSQPIGKKQNHLYAEVSPFVGRSKYFKNRIFDDPQSSPKDINTFLENVSIKSSPTKSPHYALSLSSSEKPSLKDRGKLVQKSTPHVPFPKKFNLSDPKLVDLSEESLLKESPGSKNLSAYISFPQGRKRSLDTTEQPAFSSPKKMSDIKDKSISLISDEEPES
ncbi:hypothetical protein ACO0QE_001570 [Hanseniaspora vineae]